MTIKQVCERFGLTADTLRYYEKIGVIPEVPRTSGGIRNYDETALGWVENAICMRGAGVPVESIIEYVRLFRLGDETLTARRDLLRQVRAALLEQRKQIDTAIERLEHKIGRYQVAVDTGVLSWDEPERKNG